MRNFDDLIVLAKADAKIGHVNIQQRFNTIYRHAWYEEQKRIKTEAIYNHYLGLYRNNAIH